MAGLGVIIFVADLWAVVSIFGSDAGLPAKFGWAAIVFLLPVIGFVAWLIAGPTPGRA